MILLIVYFAEPPDGSTQCPTRIWTNLLLLHAKHARILSLKTEAQVLMHTHKAHVVCETPPLGGIVLTSSPPKRFTSVKWLISNPKSTKSFFNVLLQCLHILITVSQWPLFFFLSPNISSLWTTATKKLKKKSQCNAVQQCKPQFFFLIFMIWVSWLKGISCLRPFSLYKTNDAEPHAFSAVKAQHGSL